VIAILLGGRLVILAAFLVAAAVVTWVAVRAD
jgi:hypothetical protein